MAAPIVQHRPSLHDADWQAWITLQEELLRAGRRAELDLVNLAAELRDTGASERRELRNRLVTVMMHPLKYEFQPAMRSRSSLGTVAEQRIRIDDALRVSPSLAAFLAETYSDPRTYRNAVRRAVLETDLPASAFPAAIEP